MFDASHGHLLTFSLYLNFEKLLQSKFLTFPVILKFEMDKNIMYLGCHTYTCRHTNNIQLLYCSTIVYRVYTVETPYE